MSAKMRGGDMHELSPIRDRLFGVTVDAVTGIVGSARQVPSPNCDDRPPGVVADIVVIHGISLPPGEFGGPFIDQLFQNRLPPDAHPYFAGLAGLKVSSHLLVRRDGHLVQYVPLHRRAWHAGQSRFGSRQACNDFSIGIELEGTDDLPYQPVQYVRLAALLAALMQALPALAEAPIVGHSDIAPGRKTDPGAAFSWSRLRHWLRVFGAAAGRQALGGRA
jgi:N-acetyl-anhydromuramoyl-L-alanine amidase